MSTDFAAHVHERVVAAFRSIPADTRSDIYVLSLFVYDEDDDPRLPTVTPDYNTETYFREEQASPFRTSDAEARWNYACWEQLHLTLIADRSYDPAGATLRERWIRNDLHMWYEDGAPWDERGEPITQAFVNLLVGVCQRLHAEGTVIELVGRPVPILIHELEYYDQIAEQNLRANPPGLVPDEFVDWCHGIG